MTVDDLQADSLVNHIYLFYLIRFARAIYMIYIWYIYVGRGEGSVCPIRAFGDFLALRGSSPLFTFSDGRPLTRQQLSSTFQSILHSAGYTDFYSGHSFRTGAATTAAVWGVPNHLIKTLGRWSSDAYQIYSRTPGV